VALGDTRPLHAAEPSRFAIRTPSPPTDEPIWRLYGCASVGTILDGTPDRRNAPVVPFTLADKIEAEHRLREFLRENGLPQPDEVEYGHACVRFFFNESKTCVVVDLEP
jgi:hypothetical protein